MSTAITPYRSSLPAGRDGFLQVLHAEWTKFRTVPSVDDRGSRRPAADRARRGAHGRREPQPVCVATGGAAGPGPHHVTCQTGHPEFTLGPDGDPVIDQFSFVHQPLTPDGSITAPRELADRPVRHRVVPTANPSAGVVSGVQQWAKAGVIVKKNLTPGCP